MTGTSGGIKAGKAFILIEAIDRTGKILDSIRNKLGRYGAQMTNMGRNMAIRAAAGLTPVALSTKVYSDFDDVMRKVEARAEGTASQMAELRDQAKQLGATSAFSATAVGELQNELAQKGYNRSQIGQMTEPILNLARAAGEGKDLALDAVQSAQLVSGVMQAYGLGVEKAAELSDKFTTAIVASNFNLEELVTTMAYAAPASARFSVPLDHVLAMASAMRDLNIDASIVGTAIRNIQTYAAKGKEQDEFNAKLKELTGNTINFQDALHNLNNPLEFLLAMGKAMEGLGSAQTAELYDMIFETRAGVPAAALSKATDKIEKFLVSLRNSEGAAKRMSNTMDAGIGGSLRRLTRQVEAIALALGEAFAPTLIYTETLIKPFVGDLIKWINNNRKLVTTIILSTAAFGVAGIALVVFGQIMLGIAPIISLLTILTTTLSVVLTTAAALITTPWIAAYAAMFAVGLAISSMHTDLIGNVRSIKDSILSLVSVITGTLLPSIKSIKVALAGGDIALAMKVMTATLKVEFLTIVEYIRNFISGVTSEMDRLSLAWEGAMRKSDIDSVKRQMNSLWLSSSGKDVLTAKLKDYEERLDTVKQEIARINNIRQHGPGMSEQLKQATAELNKAVDDVHAAQQRWSKLPATLELPPELQAFRDIMHMDLSPSLSSRVADLIVRGENTPYTSSSIPSLDVKSIEALRQAMENARNASEHTQDDAKRAADKLEDIDEKLGVMLETGTGII